MADGVGCGRVARQGWHAKSARVSPVQLEQYIHPLHYYHGLHILITFWAQMLARPSGRTPPPSATAALPSPGVCSARDGDSHTRRNPSFTLHTRRHIIGSRSSVYLYLTRVPLRKQSNSLHQHGVKWAVSWMNGLTLLASRRSSSSVGSFVKQAMFGTVDLGIRWFTRWPAQRLSAVTDPDMSWGGGRVTWVGGSSTGNSLKYRCKMMSYEGTVFQDLQKITLLLKMWDQFRGWDLSSPGAY